MKFIAVTTAIALVLATTVASKAVDTAEKSHQEASTPQECTTLSKCPCAAGQTQFCGNEVVNPACLDGHLFVCDETAGRACDKGVDGSCKK
ncbi:hypothetical protein PILCRDRAFT_823174 [Piloderma croceum F 1598]|uniref:Carbohydrate-binding module family 19 domain-containing protein n=1 Tax=Piloderma croceum (strain F 1598) TaxID=765440 RepID=A0A0C3FJM1_PILCF|nr:hypothetical protein PILCRDRAFT_823174 [Piloderma croceum F 1598]